MDYMQRVPGPPPRHHRAGGEPGNEAVCWYHVLLFLAKAHNGGVPVQAWMFACVTSRAGTAGPISVTLHCTDAPGITAVCN